MKICPRCDHEKCKSIKYNVIDPAEDKFLCPECGLRFNRYDKPGPKWDFSFISSKETCLEDCPECACETEIPQDGTGVCEHCGYKQMLPCSACQDIHHDHITTMNQCDWTEGGRCTPFPRIKQMFERREMKTKIKSLMKTAVPRYQATPYMGNRPSFIKSTNSTAPVTGYELLMELRTIQELIVTLKKIEENHSLILQGFLDDAEEEGA